MAVAAMQGADQHIRVEYLARGHANMQTRGIEPATFWYQDNGSTPEPQPHVKQYAIVLSLFAYSAYYVMKT